MTFRTNGRRANEFRIPRFPLIIRKFLCCASGAAFKCGVKNSKNKIVGGTETEVQPYIYIYLY